MLRFFAFFLSSSMALQSIAAPECRLVTQRTASDSELQGVWRLRTEYQGLQDGSSQYIQSKHDLELRLQEKKALDEKKISTARARPFWSKVIAFFTGGHIQIGKKGLELKKLKAELKKLLQTIKDATKSVDQKREEIIQARKNMERTMQEFILNNRVELSALLNEQISKNLKNDPAITYRPEGLLDGDALSGRVYQYYKVNLTLEKVHSITVKVVLGFKDSVGNKPSIIYSYIISNSRFFKENYYRAMVEELFKRNAVLITSSGGLRRYNGNFSLEFKLKRLGYDLQNPKTIQLINNIRSQTRNRISNSYAALRLIEGASARYPSGMSSDQHYVFNNMLWYHIFDSSDNRYLPPTHWMLYQLEQPGPQLKNLGRIFHEAVEQPSGSLERAEDLDRLIEKQDGSILTIIQTTQSEDYRSFILDSGIAETLDLNPDKLSDLAAQDNDIRSPGATDVEASATTQQDDNTNSGGSDIDSSGPGPDMSSSGSFDSGPSGGE